MSKDLTNIQARIFKKDIQSEVPMTWIAEHIEDIAKSLQNLQTNTRVTDRLLIALIHDDTKVGKTEIEKVIRSLRNLDKSYLKPKENT